MRRPLVLPLVSVLAAAALAACGGGDESSSGGSGSGGGGSSAALDVADWDSVLAAAEGSTVDWYMYGGDDRLNEYVNGYVADELEALGVTLNQVRINDTAEAVDRVLAEKQAGRDDDGSVDLVWVNGENFATLKQADGWYCGWASQLPNASAVDLDDPTIASDFGVPVDDCEAAWNRAQSVLVYDSTALAEGDVADLDALEAWARENPGRFTYAAPPDFTGSMVVRTFFYDVARAAGQEEAIQGEFDQAVYDELAPQLWERLNALEPSLWRSGETYPEGGPDVEQLFADDEIDAYISYDSGSIAGKVEDGTLPESTREAVLDPGMIGNTNYVGIPYNAADRAGALVLANLLQSPEAQYEKQVDGPGYYPAIDPELAGGEWPQRFADIPTPESQLPFEEQVEGALPELQTEWLTALEEDWRREVLQR